MSRFSPHLLAILLALGGGSPTAQAAPYEVELIVPSDLRPLLEPHLQIMRERDDPRLSRTRFQFLARRAPDEIRNLLATEGFFSPTIGQTVERREGGSRATIRVDPGQPSRITSLDLSYIGDFAIDETHDERAAALRRAWTLRPGMVFRDALWSQNKASLLRGLQQEQFPAARIADSLADVDPELYSVDLHVTLDSGPRFRFGKIEVSGIETLPEQVVTGLNRIKPGMPYREQDLEDLQNRLRRSGYFNTVFVSIATDAENPDAVPVRVSVTENLERTLGFGVGYSTDVGFGVELRYEDNLTFRPGWRSNSSLRLDQKEQSARTRLQLVPLARGFQPVVSAEVRRRDIQNEETVTTRVIGQVLNVSGTRELSLSLDFNYEWRRVEGESRDDITAVPVNLSWTRRELDDLLFPRSGYIVNLQAGGALDGLLSNTSFFRLYGRGNYYYPVGARGKLLLRGEVGAVESDSRDDIPTDYLFRTGGSQSVRGYEFGSLGVAEGDAIVPGRYIAVASAELMFPVSGDWFGAVFVDAGNAVDRVQDYEAKFGYGAGARWMSPLGPLNLDVAYGEADSTWRLHFSISSVF